MSSRPKTLLKLATSLDGRIALANGESQWITGEDARARVHALRATHDAVLVGGGTLRADDPALTARGDPRSPTQPLRVVIDTRLEISPGARLLMTLDVAPLLIVCGPDADPNREQSLIMRGARVWRLPTGLGGLDLPTLFDALFQDGVRSVLVEGGGELAASLFSQGLVDEIEWHRAPMVLGGDGRACLGGLGLEALKDAPRVRRVAVETLGPDLIERYVVS